MTELRCGWMDECGVVMIEPTQEDIGRKVLYRAAHGLIEEGVLVAFNSVYVFVRYGTDVNSKATRREDCEWIIE